MFRGHGLLQVYHGRWPLIITLLGLQVHSDCWHKRQFWDWLHRSRIHFVLSCGGVSIRTNTYSSAKYYCIFIAEQFMTQKEIHGSMQILQHNLTDDLNIYLYFVPALCLWVIFGRAWLTWLANKHQTNAWKPFSFCCALLPPREIASQQLIRRPLHLLVTKMIFFLFLLPLIPHHHPGCRLTLACSGHFGFFTIRWQVEKKTATPCSSLLFVPWLSSSFK